MTIYALFVCIASIHQCQLAAPGRTLEDGTVIPGIVYKTKAQCDREAASYNQGIRTNAMRYRCLSRHIDTWQ